MQYAIVLKNSYSVPGDERSRTNPGHGYPAHDVKYTEFKQMKDRDELILWLERNEARSYGKITDFKVISYTELPVTVTVNIGVPEPNSVAQR